MKLINCKACNKQISATADVCPHCGHNHAKDRETDNNFRQMLYTCGFIAVGFILYKVGLLSVLFEKVVSSLPTLGK
jgi:hypothetical protein